MNTNLVNETDFPFSMSQAAIVKAAYFISQEASSEFMLRIAVQAGGCSGLRYQLYLDDKFTENDLISELKSQESSLKVVCDKLSAPYLQGASIDFTDTMEKQGFQIENPNAKGGCACGDSFN